MMDMVIVSMRFLFVPKFNRFDISIRVLASPGRFLPRMHRHYVFNFFFEILLGIKPSNISSISRGINPGYCVQ